MSIYYQRLETVEITDTEAFLEEGSALKPKRYGDFTNDFVHRIHTLWRRATGKVLQHFPKDKRSVCWAALASCLFYSKILLPTFMNNQKFVKSGKDLPATAYIDGLRGIAALFVVNYHWLAIFFDPYIAYGSHQKYGDSHNIVRLSFFRLFAVGEPSVVIFFVISGFVLSLSALKHIRADPSRQYNVLSTLRSSVYRRGARLLIPTAAAMFISACVSYFGLYNFRKAPGTKYPLHNLHAIPVLRKTFFLYLKAAAKEFLNVASPLNLGFKSFNQKGTKDYPYPTFGPVIWTISVELPYSFVVFLTLLGLSHVRPVVRMTFIFVLANTLNFYYRMSFLFLFLTGIFLAELHLVITDIKWKRKTWHLVALWILLIPTLHFMALPRKSPRSPGYIWIITVIDADNVIYFSCVFFVALLILSTQGSLQRVFTTWPVQYLGKISYAIYLIHQMVQESLGYWLFVFFLDIFGVDKWNTSYHLSSNETNSYKVYAAIYLSYAIILTCEIWIADLFWRFIDIRSVTFTSWFEDKCTRPNLRKDSFIKA